MVRVLNVIMARNFSKSHDCNTQKCNGERNPKLSTDCWTGGYVFI